MSVERLDELIHDVIESKRWVVPSWKNPASESHGDCMPAIFTFAESASNHVPGWPAKSPQCVQLQRSACVVPQLCPCVAIHVPTSHMPSGVSIVPCRFEVGVGVNAGIAYVGNVGDAVVDFTALGDAVNVAARLQTQAAPGQVVLARDIHQVSAASFAVAEERTVLVSGRVEPVDVVAAQP